MADIQSLFYEQIGEKCGKNIADRVSFARDTRNVITLTGQVPVWQQVVDIGHIAGKLPGTRGVVNNLTSEDYQKSPIDRRAEIEDARKKGPVGEYDIVIIGAGITGCGAARELSKYRKKILVVEKNSDICEGTSKSNNGMIHSGYDSKTGSLKAEMNVRGNAMYTQWHEELGFKLVRSGSFIIGFDEEDEESIRGFYENGKNNGVPGIEILDGEKTREIEPNISKEATCSLWTPSAAYVEPYEVVEALMDNAMQNGVDLMLDTEVLAIDRVGDRVTDVVTNQGIIKAGCVIDAAGMYADDIAEMAGDRFYTIHNRRGTLVIMDKKAGALTPHSFVGTAPKNFTKGGGPQITPEGNPLWGPSAIEVPDKENKDVDEEDMIFTMEKGKKLTPGIDEKDIITYFSGSRPSNYVEDFIIEKSEIISNFIHVSAIQSPGVASAPAIAQRVEEIYLEMFPDTEPDPDYDPIRKHEKAFRDCSRQEQEALIAKNPLYGHVICRCETITEAEIVQAIHGRIPARTVDAVKRRTRAGMGRCQGGFCGPRVVEILARELGIDEMEVTKKGRDSRILCERSRKESVK